ncbi:MAG: thiamine ABC transporter permease [Spirochaetes bacterium]|nr:MAG: thiamine ABC transporter permease [Spirochaetota bacterium]
MKKTFSFKLTEVVTLIVLSVTLGVLWWGWTFVWGLASPLGSIGLNYLLYGFWFTGGTLIPFLIRKPGAALLGEVVAAVVEAFITQWGITAVIWGLVQGAACELVFALTRYRKYDLTVLIIAGALAGVFAYILDFFYSHYAGLQPWVWAVQIISVIISGVVLAGLLSYYVGKGIIKTGVLQNILPEESEEV